MIRRTASTAASRYRTGFPPPARPRARSAAPAPARLRRVVEDGVGRGVYPGAAWAVGDASGVWALEATGRLGDLAGDAQTRPDTLFDVASLTKILTTWTAFGDLWQRGLVDLDAPLGTYWPDTTAAPVGRLTARHLLTHTAGLPLRAQLKRLYGKAPDAIRRGVLAEELAGRPGTAVEYTDRAALILGFLTEHLAGQRLDALAARLWDALGLDATRYGPLPLDAVANCAPTEFDPETGTRPRGSVHDFSARLLGGSCGSAGVFSTAADLGRFLRHVLGAPAEGGHPGVPAEWTRYSLRDHTGPLTPTRGLLWQLAPGTEPASGIWMHSGFTGTAMWLCPRLERWAVLLTNKVYYSRRRQPLAGIRDAFRALVFG